MKINKEKVKERLAGVPEERRSHIYDASIVLEFLERTFMPTKFFLPDDFSPTPGTPLGEKSMRKVSEGKEMGIYDLYNMYLLYREEKDYTVKIESRYIFGIIVRNLRLYKNSWEFVVWRVGVAQIWHIGPLVMRKDVASEDRAKFGAKIREKTIEAVTVEADPVADPRDEDLIDDGFDNTHLRFDEVVLTEQDILDDERFTEVPDEGIGQLADEGIEQLAAEEY